jgi:muramoyltetrapeptide carboxypeptidase
MAIIPPYLKKGDTIGLFVLPALCLSKKQKHALNVLQSWGYNVRVGKTLGSQFHYFQQLTKNDLMTYNNAGR